MSDVHLSSVWCDLGKWGNLEPSPTQNAVLIVLFKVDHAFLEVLSACSFQLFGICPVGGNHPWSDVRVIPGWINPSAMLAGLPPLPPWFLRRFPHIIILQSDNSVLMGSISTDQLCLIDGEILRLSWSSSLMFFSSYSFNFFNYSFDSSTTILVDHPVVTSIPITLSTLHFTLHTLHFTLHTPHTTFHTSHSTLHTLQPTL